MFHKAVSQFVLCKKLCAKCGQKQGQSGFNCVPLGENSQESSVMAVIMCKGCSEASFLESKAGRKRLAYSQSKIRTKQKMRSEMRQIFSVVAGSDEEGKIMIEDMCEINNTEKKMCQIITQLEDNIQATLNHFRTVFNEMHIFGPVSACLTNKLPREKASNLSRQTKRAVSQQRTTMNKSQDVEYVLKENLHFRNCTESLESLVTKEVKTTSGINLITLTTTNKNQNMNHEQ